MSKWKPDVYLQDILESIQQIEEYLADVNENEFYKNSEKQDAVLRRLEIIGEAVNTFLMTFVMNMMKFPGGKLQV